MTRGLGRALVIVAALAIAAPARAAGNGSDSERFAALVGLARVERDAGDVSAARRYFDEARALRPLAAPELAEYFWIVAATDPSGAMLVGVDVLKALPHRDDVRDRMIAAAAASHDEAAAVALATAGARVDPASALWPRRLGQSLLRQGKPARAAAAFRSALQLAGADPRDRAELAVALEAAHQPGAALAAWSRVPASIRDERIEWTQSRLRALAAPGAPTAASELETWLHAHPDDGPTRAALVSVLTWSHQPERAIEIMTEPRDVHTDAASLWHLASLYLDAKDYARGEAAVRDASAADPCADQAFAAFDRLPDPLGTDAMMRALHAPACAASTSSLRRALARAVALERHGDALAIVERLPADAAGAADMRRLRGQLLLWTAQPAAAVSTLEPFVTAYPADETARLALIDAYRAVGRSTDAWTTARPIVDGTSTLPDALALSLADTALEADAPADVARVLSRASGAMAASGAAAERIGRAALLSGRSREAARILGARDPATLSPAGALALIDAVAASSGRVAARDTAAGFTASTPEWHDVLARRVVLEAVTGRADSAAHLRATLAAIDPTLASVTDAEIALADERPHDALTALRRLGLATPTDRVRDLEATALEGIGDETEAAARFAALAHDHPESATYAIRATVAEWRRDPTIAARDAVLDLPRRWPSNAEAAIAAATARLRDGDAAGAVRVLGDRASWPDLPAARRVLAAQSLRQLGDTAGALALVDGLPDLEGDGLLLRAELIATVRGPADATAAFRDAAGRTSARPDLFLAWSRIAPSRDDQLAILREGASKFPANAALLTNLAGVEWRAGHAGAAADVARRAVAVDAGSSDAWFVLADVAAADSGAALDALLDAFDAQTTGRAPLVIGMAEHVAALTPTPNSRVIARALGWLDAIPSAGPVDLARVHVLAAASDWPAALAAADRAVAHDPSSPTALALRAQVLSWAGRDDEAIAAYDVYLSLAPNDLDARRQQARVAGWAGHVAETGRLYAALRARVPDNQAVAAEADAKIAFLTGRWRDAIAAYQRWLALEPSDTEARFELAEATRADHDAAGADAMLASLAATTGHRLASVALARAAELRQPAITASDDETNANGYGGSRLLDLRQRGGTLGMTFGPGGATAATIQGAALSASGGDLDRTGARIGGTIAHQLSRRVDASADLFAWTFGGASMTTGTARASWRSTDRWTYSAGLVREALLENVATIDQAVTASGAFVGTAASTPSASLDVQAASERLSDGNGRQHTTLSFTHIAGDRLRDWQAVIWAESLSYRTTSTSYFSPDTFLRIDGGIEYRHPFTAVHFRGDRENVLVAGYLIGTDNHGVLYQHPTLRLSLDLARGLAIDARGSWIRSASYDETAFVVGLRVVVAGPRN